MDSSPSPPANHANDDIPLGAQPERYHRPENFIDLTADNDDDHPPPTQRIITFNTTLGSGSTNRINARNDVDNDEIIITGESHPARPPPSQPARSIPTSSTNRSDTTTNQTRTYPNLPEHMASLTANIHAGLYSRHSMRDPAPHPSSSNLTVRDLPPPQTRQPTVGAISFGGGGRFSGGQFSGFLAASFSGIRRLAGHPTTTTTTSTGARRPTGASDESLHRMLSTWSSSDERMMSTWDRVSAHLRGHLPLLTPGVFAAVYDFDHTTHAARPPPMPPSYKEQDSHPLKLKNGFSKEIIPLDREVLLVEDNESQSHPQPEKQDLRPICASCDEELLMDQDSCSVGSLDGRRPWILACGHVVDSRCLEKARIRARQTKFKSHQSKKARAAERLLNSHPQTRAVRSTKINPPAASSSSKVPNNSKRRRLSSAHSAQNLKAFSLLSSNSSNNQAISDLALKRKERAEAREARKSIDFSKPPSSLLSESLQTGAVTTHSKNLKGKGKAKEEQISLSPSTEQGSSSTITIPPKPNTPLDTSSLMSENYPSAIISSNLQFASTVDNLSKKLAGSSSAAPFVSWVKCPVKSCRGGKGDLLAPVGSKKRALGDVCLITIYYHCYLPPLSLCMFNVPVGQFF
ncbi:hypothetical protein Pst134EA_033261 [Puccinia striiformis f. sp. tritici]|uniref:hypothetical protein n=1 Tax=Puccinia striiformis f. sp. tritici TaxID=168172 RepID=UPI002008D9D8|nr:hypothetical protein Pst134EA_033261 [Puccinia striiformis f. sp. tritici]KAH9472401.1 hypothetical protein Pst134EA_033261 [Puccinia striiformis f. sp. tritici]